MRTADLDLSAGRVLSIDVFRGITIFVMVFVNELSGISDIPWWMKHLPASTDGMTFVDLVFPAFLFIVGMSVPFAMQARARKGENSIQQFKHLLLRSLGLVIIGVLMVSTIGGFDEARMALSMPVWTLLMYLAVLLVWAQYPRQGTAIIRNVAQGSGVLVLLLLAWSFRGPDGSYISPQWWGILGLIGWAYLLAGSVFLISRRVSHVRLQLLVLGAAALCFLVLFALLDGQAASAGQAAVGFIQHWAVENNSHTHTAIVLAGVMLSILCYHPALQAKRSRNLLVFAGLLGVLAFASWQWFPISKIWATPSWALFSAWFCTLLFVAVFVLVDLKGYQRWCRLFAPAAVNPLLAYILPYMLASAAAIAGATLRPVAFDTGVAGIFWSLAFAAVILLLTALLTRLGLKVKL
ncbi:DUF5009 domain-containing protein [Rheinheimera sp. F8]|uniref:DUF5009 domain-containing protein n=1 Tax=Rheinheimera sp. F8 TaxID=1763998 RepID=UPI0007449B63|nr:DUF5009 domain-containing protein [Rheinheimera sp. F8]ALZ76671.1 hypothetical protein ATY27_13500 [Rheinheimera sp. F8]